MIRWFANNPVAANLMMLSIMVLGYMSYNNRMVVEFFPSVTVDVITVRIPYRGATPSEVEESICIRIEEAIQDLEGIEKLSSSAMENIGRVTVEVESGYEPREIMDDIKNRVDAISTFPAETERPVYTLASRKKEVLSVVVAAERPEAQLRQIVERVKDELLALEGVTQVEMGGVRTPEMVIEISERTLRKHSLTLEDVSQRIKALSLDLPAGSITTDSGEVLIRSLGQAYDQATFENMVIVQEGDAMVRLSDLGKVVDTFEEDPLFARFNGKSCGVIEVTRVGDQSALALSDAVKKYVKSTHESGVLGAGVEIEYWRDRGRIIRSRLATLTNSAWQGGLLVLAVLTLFLRPALAFWVCLGIPVSFMGGLIFMPSMGVSINIISLFGFILVLGIVVDDAIVTGENIFRHIREGKDPALAAIEGTQEVSVPVTFGVLTTAVAFIPLLMLDGRRGDIFSQLPLVIIPVLFFSLVESKLILPCHLTHLKVKEPTSSWGIMAIQSWFMLGMEKGIKRCYLPVLSWTLRHKMIALVLFFGSTSLVFAYFASGRVGFQPFPRVASEAPRAFLTMPLGTPFELTAKHIQHITDQVHILQEKYRDPVSGESVIKNIMSIYGGTEAEASGQSHLGKIQFEVVPPERRALKVSSAQLTSEWRALVGQIPGAESLTYRAEIGRGGEPVDIQLNHRDFDQLQRASEVIKSYLATIDGVFDISDSFQSGKQELQIRLKPLANTLGVTTRSLSSQIRNAFFGAEAQRIQRGQDELRVMVRYPLEERGSLYDLYKMRIRVPSGAEVPIGELAHIDMKRSFSTIQRVDRKRTLNITADIDKANYDQGSITAAIQKKVPEIIAELNPRIGIDMEGETRESREMGTSLRNGFMLAFFLIYALLAIPFKSYGQPFIVLGIIPFGLVGAILGHMIMGISASFPSIFGILALMGVVVNDSLVLVDYINRHRSGRGLMEAIQVAGVARFRPIVLTSLTTFFGLIPLLLEQSTQSQFLKPMAVSLGFGILFATVITLLVTPLFYCIYEMALGGVRRLWPSPKAETLEGTLV